MAYWASTPKHITCRNNKREKRMTHWACGEGRGK